ncbi:MAG: dockerin type I repeat-containing protein [Muribaculaceae bacterium]|nr:dockerin type I repeat-containing protein [Muribaculaceae bacterium]
MKKVFALSLVLLVSQMAFAQNGDVDGDGAVTSADVTCLYNYLLDGDETYLATSDVDGDGFITVGDITLVYNILLGNVHEYVDLGLPSGTLWAMTNVGASNPEDYGDYFAWGETTTKDVYNWSTYKWCNGSENAITKYSNNIDNKTELDPEDDAATANWGPEWRMPSKEQINELIVNCTDVWTKRNGVWGRLVTSKINGASIFFPAAGYRWDSEFGNVGSFGSYWSRSRYVNSQQTACYLIASYYNNLWCTESVRSSGESVRAVRVSQK